MSATQILKLVVLSLSILAPSWGSRLDPTSDNSRVLTMPAYRQQKGSIPKFCPEESVIAPCTCEAGTLYNLYCDGPLVTRESIQALTPAIRQENQFGEHVSLNIAYLHITNTTLTHLNLDDLDVGHSDILFGILDISGNLQLKFINGSITIDAMVLELEENGLTDQELATGMSGVFQATAGYMMSLYLGGNLLTGSPIDEEGHTAFHTIAKYHPDLHGLSLVRNKMSYIGGGQFEMFDRLSVLSLQDNEVVELGDHALRFLSHWPYPDGLRQIYMYKNNLTDAKISPLAFSGLNAPSVVYLGDNDFEFVSAANFEQLFSAPVENPSYRPRTELTNNHFVCDERMRWLHDQATIFQNSVLGIDCVNDPGKDIFNTTLLD